MVWGAFFFFTKRRCFRRHIDGISLSIRNNPTSYYLFFDAHSSVSCLFHSNQKVTGVSSNYNSSMFKSLLNFLSKYFYFQAGK